MKKSQAIIFIFFLLLSTLPAMGQGEIIVKGNVTSASDGLGLPGVSIVVKGTQQGTVTDIDGNFNIKVNAESQILTFSMIGYEKKEISVKEARQSKIVLSESTEMLDEVLIVGYGVQKKASAVGSISQTKGDELLKAGGATNLSTALAGMLPGVTSISSSGEPGLDQAKIYIRGRSTWEIPIP